MDLTASNHITRLKEKRLKCCGIFFYKIDISNQCNCKQRHEPVESGQKLENCFMLKLEQFPEPPLTLYLNIISSDLSVS